MTPTNRNPIAEAHLGDVWKANRSMGLGRALQKAGYGTRKVADAIVSAGRVVVDGVTVTDPKSMVGSDTVIHLDGKPMRKVLKVYMVLNKPARMGCTPGEGEPMELVSQILPSDIPGLRPVGRMDARNMGLLLITNDKDWNTLMVDSDHLENEYRIQVEGELTVLEVGVISAGINIPKMGAFKPLSVRIVEVMNGKTVLNVVLTEGKIRQLRRMFSTLRHKIIYLLRIRIGDLRLGNLPPGRHRYMTSREVQSLRNLVAQKPK